MSETDERYWLLSKPSGIEKTHSPELQRNYPPSRVFSWLKAGWHDVYTDPWPSLLYGLMVSFISALLIYCLFEFNIDYILLPTLSGFLIMAPLLAMGLYQKSAKLARNEPVTLADLMGVKAASGGQVFFVGLMLSLLALVWIRAAVIVYALFYGYRAFPGIAESIPLIFGTPLGLAMLFTGVCVGGLFAAFGFAVSAFSVPMLLDRRTDALTAMGTSMALVWNNFPVMLAWGAVVLALVIVSIATALIGFIVIFPLLGHATWHAYRDMIGD
ncbi:DUF2189 domain-containing protein [Pelagibacterium lacus]|uniref:DUF2189 domain-containing protein n=1 Tax=Pelagibacterium lacus TaxID=2282655 RepID=A0A369W247_9HYPH|nr:DUF2189 domain-containing protein [Pelagibacterium lacus]RDE08099.1 DUF2189 domain-containing protein [Pelagibacterium lacus]